MAQTLSHDLTGKLLIAMPGLQDTRFEGGLVYLCAHSDEGSMGLIINKVSTQISAKDVFEQLDISPSETMDVLDVCYGGPVEMARGFVLHSTDYCDGDTSLPVDDTFSMTASKDILRDIAQGNGPNQRLLCLGYAGWSPGQLDAEIAQNAWLTCDADSRIVFDLSGDQKWAAALETLGVSAALLSAEFGRA
ncbi:MULTISPECIES: YqgE/AlgH family protein [Pacificibacter]|uniref:YqgE/AlgH family protein n=1 Tax=Pacificibacter TaxID=1042323 RepID=UPI001C09F000|nr:MULTISPECIES: YqgE/AlgH family protein [Pacificibacter]MBU2934696.1 YqgE/AlgH family protein [Pacificibacter marinus]MDO6616862.1 YqgE/AlgH family protein [Pacificibacter sp. 1_MG-2023]